MRMVVAGGGGKTEILLGLIPLVCIYVDALCAHLSLRIRGIGEYIRSHPPQNDDERYAQNYEKFIRLWTDETRLEPLALHWTTTLVSLLVITIGFLRLWQAGHTALSLSSLGLMGLVVSGIVGVLLTLWIRAFHNERCHVIADTGKAYAEKDRTPGGQPQRRRSFLFGWLSTCWVAAFYALTMPSETEGQTVHYVRKNNPNAAPPYTNWYTAAANIQMAINVATNGDTVLVTNGVYDAGVTWAGDMNCRIAITNAIVVRSVNGPGTTTIKGEGPIWADAVRCAYLADGALLAGFTLTNGATRDTYAGSGFYPGGGGGVLCLPNLGGRATVSNCVIAGNMAGMGGGALGGTYYDCRFSGNTAVVATWGGRGGGAAYVDAAYRCSFSGNSAQNGGGLYAGTGYNCDISNNSASRTGGGGAGVTLYNTAVYNNRAAYVGGVEKSTIVSCTVVGNVARFVGGVSGGVVCNSIVYYNWAGDLQHNYGENPVDNPRLPSFENSCTTPAPVGVGNVSSPPGLATLISLATNSGCIAQGSASYAVGSDIDGEGWRTPPSMGADEPYPGGCTGVLSVAISSSYSRVATGLDISIFSRIEGRATRSAWDFGDGATAENEPVVTHAWQTSGVYTVSLRAWNMDNPAGVACTAQVEVVESPCHFVSVSNTTPVAPYTNWTTAATRIQDAVDAAVPGGVVWVADGVYSQGVVEVFELEHEAFVPNRIAVMKPLTLQSVSGPTATVIEGAPGVRCAYLTDRVLLSGFKLRKGAPPRFRTAGGCYCEGAVTLTNCVVVGNVTDDGNGGGIAYANLIDCIITGNTGGEGGGAYKSTLSGCEVTDNTGSQGGGVAWCQSYNCMIQWNHSEGNGGGGGFVGTYQNCLIAHNSSFCSYSDAWGGGVFGQEGEETTLNNCTVAFNQADIGGGVSGWPGTPLVYNSIVYNNTAREHDDNYYRANMAFCCTMPMPAGGTLQGNTTNDPLFVSSNDLHIQEGSPCIDTGRNRAWMRGAFDLDGRHRVIGPSVDMGAYEVLPGALSDGDEDGLPDYFETASWEYWSPMSTGSDPAARDTDGDTAIDGDEIEAGTDPCNAGSVLQIVEACSLGSGSTVRWQSASGVRYRLVRSTNLVLGFDRVVRANIVATPPTNEERDADVDGHDFHAYRVEVERP